MSNKNKNRNGIVFSTNPDYEYQYNDQGEPDTLEPSKQTLRVLTDSKMRAGKIVTIVHGFIGKQTDFNDLAKVLKTACGVGGTAKDGQIIIQGNFKDRIIEILLKKGYKAK